MFDVRCSMFGLQIALCPLCLCGGGWACGWRIEIRNPKSAIRNRQRGRTERFHREGEPLGGRQLAQGLRRPGGSIVQDDDVEGEFHAASFMLGEAERSGQEETERRTSNIER
jgi:hypothetical protein